MRRDDDDVSDSVKTLDSFHFHLDRLATQLAQLLMEPPPDAATRTHIASAEYHVRQLATAIESARVCWAWAERPAPSKRVEPKAIEAGAIRP